MNEAKTIHGMHRDLWVTNIRNRMDKIIGRGAKESNQRMRDGLSLKDWET